MSVLPKKLLDLGFSLLEGILSFGEAACNFTMTGKHCRVTLPTGEVFDIEGVDRIQGDRLTAVGQGQVGLVLD